MVSIWTARFFTVLCRFLITWENSVFYEISLSTCAGFNYVVED